MDRQERVRILRERQRVARIRRDHPEWYRATDFHWLDPGSHDFWNEAFRGCGYAPGAGNFMLFGNG